MVTPGPLMNKSVTVLRQPKAGETTVSLSGSPLLPSGGVVGKKVFMHCIFIFCNNTTK